MNTTAKNLPEKSENNIVSVGNSSPMEAMTMALSQGADLEKLEKMLELQERWEQNEAKKAYTQAMAEFKADPPKINKDKHVDFKTQKGRTSYDHASLGNVTSKINTSLASHGLTAAWKTDQNQGGITVTCTITHKLGYSESTSLTAGAETSGTKNNIQAIGSTITYLQRYTLLALTGLATHDQDDDGTASEVEYINIDQRTEINDLIADTQSDLNGFLEYIGVASVDTIPVNKYNMAKTALQNKKR